MWEDKRRSQVRQRLWTQRAVPSKQSHYSAPSAVALVSETAVMNSTGYGALSPPWLGGVQGEWMDSAGCSVQACLVPAAQQHAVASGHWHPHRSGPSASAVKRRKRTLDCVEAFEGGGTGA